MEVNGDWLALTLEQLQAATREVRLTLPPGDPQPFWPKLLERARLLPHRLTVYLLLPSDPLTHPGMPAALEAIHELEESKHVVSLSATDTPLPYFLIIADRETAVAAVGDPYTGDDATLVQLLTDPARVQDLLASYDRRFDQGVQDPDLDSWRRWLDRFPSHRDARSAVRQLRRGQEKLAGVTRRTLARLPKRRFWIVKPHPASWGMNDDAGVPVDRWLQRGRLHLGWPKLAEDLHEDPAGLSLAQLRHDLARHYPDVDDAIRVRAVLRAFHQTMRPRDRVIAIDGWTAHQTAPVRVHAWGRIDGSAERGDSAWPWFRPVSWREAAIDLPVKRVREATGLQSATYPLHRLEAGRFRELVEAVEARRRKGASPQMSLTLDLFPQKSDQDNLI